MNEPIPLILLAVAGPIAFVLSVISTLYLASIYERTLIPRSWFFRMLIQSSWMQIAGGLWIGYLSLARMGAAYNLFDIPLPSPTITSPITIIVVIALISPPIYYALIVSRIRNQRTSVEQRRDQTTTSERETIEDTATPTTQSEASPPVPNQDG